MNHTRLMASISLFILLLVGCNNNSERAEVAKERQKREDEIRLRQDKIIRKMDAMLVGRLISWDNYDAVFEITNTTLEPISAFRVTLYFSTKLDGYVCSWDIDYNEEFPGMTTKRISYYLNVRVGRRLNIGNVDGCQMLRNLKLDVITSSFTPLIIILKNGEELRRLDYSDLFAY